MTEDVKPLTIVLADGMTKDNHLEDRHLIPIRGTPLIRRTVKQFGSWSNVKVATKDDRIWNTVKSQRNVFRYRPRDQADRYHGIDMIRKGLDAATAQRTIIVFGDVVFTDEAVETIRTNEVDHWAVYGRSTDNTITGTPWAEYFAIEIDWLSRAWGKDAVEKVASFYKSREWPFCTAWEWYYHMEKMPYDGRKDVRNVKTGPHWVEINDATDDIDYQQDADNMRRVYEMA